MRFLVQIKTKTDGTAEKGTSSYDTEKDAVVAFHVAMSSAMQKDDTQKCVAIILDDDGKITKREVYTVPVVEEIAE